MNVPKLRFKDFNDEWQKDFLNNNAVFLQGLTYKPNDVSNKGIIVLRSSNIQNSMIDYNDIVKVNIDISPKLRIRENDILMCVRNGSKNLVGKSAWLSNNEERCTWGAFMNVIRPLKKNKFIYYYLNSKYFYNYIWKDLGTATVNQITLKTLNDCKLFLPSEEEQEKIGTFLSLLDKKIELQSKKIEALKLYKKGLLKAQYYKIKDINNVEISQFAKVYQPTTLSQSNLKGGEYSVFGANGIIGYHNEYNHELEQVTISCRGENSGKINLTPQKCWINGNSMVINIDNSSKITKDYLYYILNSQNLNYLISGSGQPQITSNVVLNHKIPLIEYNKQYHYAKVFNCFGKKIKLEENKLTKLEKIKKGLMQNMFV